MKTRTKRFICDDCGAVEFDVTVEPAFENQPVTKDQQEWLDDISYCPVCGNSNLEEKK